MRTGRNLHEVLHPVLLQHHETVELTAALPRAILTLNHRGLLGVTVARHTEQVKHLHLEQGSTGA